MATTPLSLSLSLSPHTPVWVVTAPCIPAGAQVLGKSPQDDRIWLDVCLMGQHLPQMYREAEIRPVTKELCTNLGLCPDCLGFGDLDPAPLNDFSALARSSDQITNPCPSCQGSGRPAVREELHRDHETGSLTGTTTILQHAYVPPLSPELEGFYSDPQLKALFGAAADTCLACGMPEDSKNHNDPKAGT